MGEVPVVLFAYNRLVHLKRTFEALRNAEGASETLVYVYSDGGKDPQDALKVKSVRAFVREVSGFKSIKVIERSENLGLSKNVITGVSEVLSIHPSVIVLEDDITVSKDYLSMMSKLLTQYKNNPSIGSISGYMYPVTVSDDSDDFFLLPRASSWGWGTWNDRWKEVEWAVEDFEQFYTDRQQQNQFNQGGEDLTPMLIKSKLGLNDSWAVRWSYDHFKKNRFCLFPRHNMVINHGTDGSGTHSPNTNRFTSKQFDPVKRSFPDHPVVDPVALKGLQQFFKLSPIRKLINRVTFAIKL